MAHEPVLLGAVLDGLAPAPDHWCMDCTFGRGGHSRALLAALGPAGRLVAMDRDPEAVAAGRGLMDEDGRFKLVRAPFSALAQVAEEFGMTGRVNSMLFDLGVSSPQLDRAERGFSFLRDGPLDMRMDPDHGESAAAYLARVEVPELAHVLRRYGEERFAGPVARAIVAARAEAPIETTGRLAAIIEGAVGRREPGRHPATRTFQALRIVVNRELEELEAALAAVVPILAPGGRLAIISFHSLEDRPVKRFMRDEARGVEHPPGVPMTGYLRPPRLCLVGKPRRADAREVAANPRARSAILRIAEKLP
ncbi:MAG: 16S rRNA (cytosine(1402)-N(4))-methyltransferase RsmH [Gammaproteobacteria bacterium]|nr:16S rRNA (cytosine(1402)-N(4))-methyltransferase RsmH [Gammaproteobacteria bacterium]